MTQVMNSIEFNKFVFWNYVLLNNMITKTDAHKIKHQPNITMFVWVYNNLIESKSKQIMKTNSKSIHIEEGNW
jgi:hypothetical protein